MRIHWIQHVPFEDLGAIAKWTDEQGHDVTVTRMYEDESFPDPASVDMLVVLGGPMGVNDLDEYPWLEREKMFIREVLDHDRRVLGICLGAQLLADVLGADVTRNREPEIGFFKVEMTSPGLEHPLMSHFPKVFNAFHWHGDTFAIAGDSIHAAQSLACANQAFIYENRAVGLQFHIEATREGMENLITHCTHDLIQDTYIQSPKVMRSLSDKLDGMHSLLFGLLDKLLPSQSSEI